MIYSAEQKSTQQNILRFSMYTKNIDLNIFFYAGKKYLPRPLPK